MCVVVFLRQIFPESALSVSFRMERETIAQEKKNLSLYMSITAHSESKNTNQAWDIGQRCNLKPKIESLTTSAYIWQCPEPAIPPWSRTVRGIQLPAPNRAEPATYVGRYFNTGWEPEVVLKRPKHKVQKQEEVRTAFSALTKIWGLHPYTMILIKVK